MDVDPVLADELQELSLDRSVDTYKSPEEIERLTVDEHLSDIERAVYLLSSGQEVQRISVINNLPDLLRDHHEDCMRRVVPKVREVLHVAQAEMQLAACTAFLQILRSDLVPLGSYTQTFLQTILMAIDSRDPDVANAWLETLLDVIELLPKDVIKREILGIAIAKGQLSQSVQSRLACCSILGKIATRFEPFVIKKDILPVVQSLCQDVDYEVRGCMCRQLDPVARGLGLEATKSAILPELVELTNDEESHVRLAGLETVVNVLSLLDDDTCTDTIVPLVCKFCQGALANEDATLPAVARNIGKLCHGLSVNLNDDEKHWFVEFYRKLCRYGASSPVETHGSPSRPAHSVFSTPDLLEDEDPGVECRRNATYNLPAMVMFCGPRYFKGELSSTYTLLCKDCNYHVRKSVASGFHEVAKLMSQNIHHLLSDLIILLRDDNLEVLRGLVPNLPNPLESIANAEGPISQGEMNDLLSAMVDCEAVISSSNNWRLQAELIDKFCCLPGLFASDLIYQRIVPLMFKKLHNARALPVKDAASRTLLVLLRQTKRQEQREEICDKLVTDIGQGRSFYLRGLFVTICQQMLQLFSRQFFKDHMFEAVIDLASDPVPNIRLRVCPLLPKLKACVKLPGDRNLLQMLEQAVRKMLMNEKDIDVMNAMQKAVDELDKTQVQMESNNIRSKYPFLQKLTKKPFLEDDIDDHRKEQEEMLLIEQEEKERKDDDHRSTKRKEKEKKDGNQTSASKIPAPKKVGSKIPALSAGKDKGKSSASSSSSRAERNGTTASKNSQSTSGTTSKGGKTKPPASSIKSRIAATASTSNSIRKGSASSVGSSSSMTSGSASSLNGPRRGSLPGGSQTESSPKKHTATPRTVRRISTGSMSGNTGNGIPVRKKSIPRS